MHTEITKGKMFIVTAFEIMLFNNWKLMCIFRATLRHCAMETLWICFNPSFSDYVSDVKEMHYN